MHNNNHNSNKQRKAKLLEATLEILLEEFTLLINNL